MFNGHNDLGFVYVVRFWYESEVYVFDTEENAKDFSEARGGDGDITEEPILSVQFVHDTVLDAEENASA